MIGPCLVVPATLARKFDGPGDSALVIDSGAFRAVSAPHGREIVLKARKTTTGAEEP